MTVSVAVSAHGTVVPQANEEFTRRGGLLIPTTTDLASDQAVSRPEARPADGYTAQVRQLEALSAEAERVRLLPTQRVLKRRQELAEAAMLAELDTAEHVRRLRHQGVRETAQLGAAAEAAAGRRRGGAAWRPTSTSGRSSSLVSVAAGR